MRRAHPLAPARRPPPRPPAPAPSPRPPPPPGAARGHAAGTVYFVKEPFERLLWWLALPSLLTLAGDGAVDRDAVRALERGIAARARAAAQAGYRLESV